MDSQKENKKENFVKSLTKQPNHAKSEKFF
jgi:hypothetical protein